VCTSLGLPDPAQAVVELDQVHRRWRQVIVSTALNDGGEAVLRVRNGASFSIRSAVNAGTLVEVAFPRARIAAE
jgi:hypothetical protein